MKLPEAISLTAEGQYCLSCFANRIERFSRDNDTYYICRSCGAVAERSLVVDNDIVWWVDDDRTYWHESVGVVVVDEKKRILCLFRRIFPFAYAIPAGHLDRGESPEFAARRELQEETGINVLQDQKLEHLVDIDIPNDSCRRGSDHHRWHLFRYKLDHEPNIILSDEAASMRWCTIFELKDLKLLTFPLEVILEKFGPSLIGQED